MANRRRVFFAAVMILLFLGTNTASAGVSVGIKKGDWIEYQVFPTGHSTEGHNVTWARLEILNVEGTEITVNITTKAFNGTFASAVENFNPAEGRVGIWFIIPANTKWLRNFAISEIIVEKLISLNIKFPKPVCDISKLQIS